MQKQFLRKSILIQALVGVLVALLLVVPPFLGYASNPLLSLVGISAYALLTPTLGMIIEARVN